MDSRNPNATITICMRFGGSFLDPTSAMLIGTLLPRPSQIRTPFERPVGAAGKPS
jgi:hypothetical protein